MKEKIYSIAILVLFTGLFEQRQKQRTSQTVSGIRSQVSGIRHSEPGKYRAGFSNETPKTYKVERTTYNFKKVKQIYDAEIGVKETGNNSGKRVEEYLQYTGLKKGEPWCAAFICWVYGQAGVDNPRSAWSPALFPGSKVIWTSGESRTKNQESRLPQNALDANYGSGVRMLVRPDRQLTTGNRQLMEATPRTGDIFAIWFPEKKRIAHAGFIDHWDDKWLITVEGNTNEAGSREGDGVYRKRRLVKSIYQVARYSED